MDQHQFLLTLSDALRPLADSTAIQAEACRLLSAHLRVDRTYYAEINETEGYARVERDGALGEVPSIVGVYPLSDFDWSLPLLRRGEIVVFDDVEHAGAIPDANRVALTRLQIVAHIAVPIIKDAALVGAFCVTVSRSRAWTAAEVELVRETAERLWAFIVRARAEAALRASEEKHRTLFLTMGQGYCDCELVRDAEGHAVGVRYLEVNPAYERLVGVPAAEARAGLGRAEAVTGSEIWWVETFERIVKQGAPERIEHEVAPLGRWYSVYVYPSGGDRFIALYEDITESKGAEMVLRASEARKAFLLAVSDALRSLDDPTEVQATVSRMLGEYLGANRVVYTDVLDERELVITSDWVQGVPSLVGHHALAQCGEELLEVLRAGKIAIEDTERDPRISDAVRALFRARQVAASISTNLVEDGRWVASLGVHSAVPRCWTSDEVTLLDEVAERTWAAVGRARAEEALRDADRRKNEFLAVLSHELRNPLTPIKNSLYILDRVPPGGDQAKRAKQVIDRQVDQLSRLIDDLLEVTRITRNKVVLQRETLELGELVCRVVEDQRSLFDAGGVRLETSVQCDGLLVHGDGARLAQVVGNLLQNAAKFTQKGGTTRVEVARELDADCAVIRVRDSGVGMKPETIESLFQPFMQADSSLDRSKGGLGLGLALTKGLVELHGGEVWAWSEGLGAGSEFVVRLPLMDALAEAEPAAPSSHVAKMGCRILIIEDNADAADTLRDALELVHHLVEVSYNGPDGIARARAFRPDVVLCDIGLPGMDGYEVARVFRADENLSQTFLVALSGYAMPEDLARARMEGFDEHVAKPPSLEKLAPLLTRACRRAVQGPRNPVSAGQCRFAGLGGTGRRRGSLRRA